ncbi:MAG: hypothetical protein ACYTHM_11195 [Planctomycetota bacterium]|jgi:hypothetical protein
MRCTGIVLLFALLAFPVTLSAEEKAKEDFGKFVEIDYAKVKRGIKKLPKFNDKPKFALFIFGPAGTMRVWAVLDKSEKGGPHNDILYFDKNADLDLTQDGERFTTKFNERMARTGMAVTLRVGDVPVTGTKIVHKNFIISTRRKPGRKGIYFKMLWNGKEEISGGMGPTGMDCTLWGDSPKTAPILRPTVLGPFSFAFWGSKEVRLQRGGNNSLRLVVGHLGSAPDTLCVLDENFLDLTRERIVGVLIAKGKGGKTVKIPAEFDGHC